MGPGSNPGAVAKEWYERMVRWRAVTPFSPAGAIGFESLAARRFDVCVKPSLVRVGSLTTDVT